MALDNPLLNDEGFAADSEAMGGEIIKAPGPGAIMTFVNTMGAGVRNTEVAVWNDLKNTFRAQSELPDLYRKSQGEKPEPSGGGVLDELDKWAYENTAPTPFV